MIRIHIEICQVIQGTKGRNEFGAGVLVRTDPFTPRDTPTSEGATFVGLCMVINDYMRARGCPDFDCTKPLNLARHEIWRT